MKDLFGNEIKVDYRKYLKSAAWKRKTEQARKVAKDKCQDCGASGVDLDVHHLTYERLGNERPEDLVVLCTRCHKNADLVRERKTRQKRDAKRFDNGLNTYATKKYGEQWRDYDDYLSVAEEFQEWINDQLY